MFLITARQTDTMPTMNFITIEEMCHVRGGKGKVLYAIRVEGSAPLTTFQCDPAKGIAACLRKAAKAIDATPEPSIAMAILASAFCKS